MKSVYILIGLLALVLCSSALYAQDPTPCPEGLPEGTSCFSGRTPYGAYYLIAIPKDWNGTLFLYNRGYTPPPLTEASSLGAVRILLAEGFAMAASGYRRIGLAVGEAAEDTELLRQTFVQRFGRPKRTLVYGASYGGNVTAKLVELYGVNSDGSLNYDGALPVCGVVAGMRWFGYSLLDLRVVYQYYCQNHPRPDESPYDLYQGLPAGTLMTDQDVQDRVNECTGVNLPPEQRSERQRRNLANITQVLRIPESFLAGRLMSLATFGLRDIVHGVQGRLSRSNPLTNRGVQYTGSTDDRALNRGVLRYRSDPRTVAELSTDADLTGNVFMPILTMHAVDDDNVYVEHEAGYRDTLERAGRLDDLFQTYTNAGGHCGFNPSEVATVSHALLEWIETGNKPTQDDIVAACERYRKIYGGECRFNPIYRPNPLESRIYPRRP